MSMVRRIADAKGLSSWTESGFERSVVFSIGRRSTSIPMQIDLETFHALTVMRLIDYFPDRLRVDDFWPEAEATAV